MNSRVYLAGAITGLTWDEATAWRKQVSKALEPFGIECYSPLRFKNYLSHLDKLPDSYNNELSTGKGIVTRDRWDATRCDVLFVNLLNAKKISTGSVMEIAWADLKRIPIVIAMEEDNVHRHAMIIECAGFICTTLERAIEVTKALLINNGNENE